MLLYFITQDLNHNGFLYPRVPHAIRHDENQIINRVNLSSSIGGCLSAIPGGGMHIFELFEKNERFFKVFKIDTDKYGINPNNILKPKELYQKNFVRDAILTEEHWLLEPIQVLEEDMQYVFLESYTEFDYDLYTYQFEQDYLYNADYEGTPLETLWDMYVRDNQLGESINMEIKCILDDIELFDFEFEGGTSIELEIHHEFEEEDNIDFPIITEKLKELFSDYPYISFEVSDFEITLSSTEFVNISHLVPQLKEIILNS